jgi:hypothetical protein
MGERIIRIKKPSEQIVKVKNCQDCLCSYQALLGDGLWYCSIGPMGENRLAEKYILEDATEFPSWCPLEEAK